MSVFVKNKVDNLPSNKDKTDDGNVKNSVPLLLYQIKCPALFYAKSESAIGEKFFNAICSSFWGKFY